MNENQRRDEGVGNDPASQAESASRGKPASDPQELLQQIREANEKLIDSAIRAQEAHEAADLRFRDLVDGLDAIVWETDTDTGRFTFVSQQAEIILGYPARRWLEDPEFWPTVIHPEDREQTLKCCKAALKARQDYRIEFRTIAANGRIVWVSQRARLTSAASYPTRMLGFMIDISERKRTEEPLQQAVRNYQASENTLREKLDELERFEEAVVGRELKMIELEKEIEQLKRELETLRATRELAR
ncbi:MAG: PAS domain-containing protein [Nitrospiraceae bacterium]|nr:PAS domain-containing protein [Nitrospiraceae bacterium]